MAEAWVAVAAWVTFGAALSLAFDLLIMARRFRTPETRKGLVGCALVAALLGPLALVPLGLAWWICADQEREHQRRLEEIRESHRLRMADLQCQHEQRMDMIRRGQAPGLWLPGVWIP